jgi:hypothetical protein
MVATVAAVAAKPSQTPRFERVHTHTVPPGATAEIASADPFGRLLVYTDSNGSLGFLDIRPLPEAAPIELTPLPVDGEPTSVLITPDMRFVVAVVKGGSAGDRALVIRFQDALDGTPSVLRSIPLPGEPDSIAASHNGRHLAVAIENEASPGVPGLLAIIDADPPTNPNTWRVRSVNLQGLAAVNPSDPEPEFIAVRGNIAAVTLQENNHVVLVNLPAGAVIGHFAAGEVTQRADLTEDKNVSFTAAIAASPRIPDGIAWTRNGRLITANEGEGNRTGGRGITTFSSSGALLYDSAERIEVAASGAGLYPEGRSARKGVEIENVAVASFGGVEVALVASERGHFVSVHGVENDGSLPLLQFLPLPNGAEPEGVHAIPMRGMFVTANEGNGTIAFFAAGPGELDIVADPNTASPTGDPIWWSALSGLSAGTGDVVYAVPDSAVAPSRLFALDTSATPAIVTSAAIVEQGGAPLSFDLEGVAVRRDESGAPDPSLGFWVVSEGNSTTLSDRLLQLGASASVVGAPVELPAAVKAQALRWGFEGVAVTGAGPTEQVFIAFQREWQDDPLGYVRIGRFTPHSGAWAFFHYPLETPSSGTDALETGLSDLVAVDENTLLVIERDSRSGAAAELKRVYAFSIEGVTPTPCGALDASCPVAVASIVSNKTLVRDLLLSDDLTLEKVEGLAIRSSDTALLVATDNDGVGETRLLTIP